MGHGQAFSEGLHPMPDAGGLNWRRQLHRPASPSRMQKGGIGGILLAEGAWQGYGAEGGGFYGQMRWNDQG